MGLWETQSHVLFFTHSFVIEWGNLLLKRSPHLSCRNAILTSFPVFPVYNTMPPQILQSVNN